MKRFATFISLALSAAIAAAATLNPVQLLNPVGSTAGQAIVSTGPSTAPFWSSVTVGGLAPVTANTVLANATGSSAAPTAFAMPSCSATGNNLQYTSGTGFTCATGYALLASPGFTGTPTAPTAAAGTNTTQIATTAFVSTIFAAPPALGSTTPAAVSATTLSASSTVSGAGFSAYLASPPAIGATAANTGKFTTLQATGAITPSSTAGIVGTATNDNANGGSVGEYITATGSSVALSTGVSTNITSISLTAGDWDVWGNIEAAPTGAAFTVLVGGISTTSATTPATPFKTVIQNSGIVGTNTIIAPMQRLSLSSTTTVYLVLTPTNTGGTGTGNGYISARRVR